MKRILIPSIILLGIFQTAIADVSGEIGKLEKNDLATATAVVKALEAIALDKGNPESKTAGSLSREIKKTFTAEFSTQQASLKLDEEGQKADDLDRQGLNHMKPNALGSTNQLGAEAKHKAAREVRASALKRMSGSVSALAIALKDLRNTSQKSALSEDDQKILAGVADAIEERTLKPAEKGGIAIQQRVGQSSDNIAAEDVAREKNEDAQESQKRRDAALRQMQRAIRSGDRSDEARAMKMLMSDAPDSVSGFNDYLASKAARARAAQDDEMRRKIDEINRKIR
jgi:hypothetical protein